MHNNFVKLCYMDRSPTFYTSFLFITNAVVTFYYKYYLYSFVFLLMTITSIMVHGNYYKQQILWIDKVAIILVILTGGYIYCKKIAQHEQKSSSKYFQSIVIFFSFLFFLFMEFYGSFFGALNYDANKNIGLTYHAFLHLIGCLGHLMIVLL